MLSVLKEVPFGKFRIQSGLQMRNGILINGMLTNCEAWYGVKDNDIIILEQVDEFLLRNLLNAPSKTPKESLYLETGTKPIRYIIKQRRMMYLHHILTRAKDEMIYKVYESQVNNPVKDDWCKLITKDKIDLNIDMSDQQIESTKKYKFKKIEPKLAEILCILGQNLKWVATGLGWSD